MKRKKLRSNPASPRTKRSINAMHRSLNQQVEPRVPIESHLINWNGIMASMTFSIPFIVSVAINLQAALAITAALCFVLLPVSLLSFCLRDKLGMPPWLAAPLCALVSVGITAFIAVYIRANFAQINDALGMYLYLLAAYPVVGAVSYGRRAKSVGITIVWALRNILCFGTFTCLAGAVREVLAYNRFAGLELTFMELRMEAAKAPFFGFIVLAFCLSGAAVAYRIINGRQMAADTDTDEDYSRIAADELPEDGKQNPIATDETEGGQQ